MNGAEDRALCFSVEAVGEPLVQSCPEGDTLGARGTDRRRMT